MRLGRDGNAPHDVRVQVLLVDLSCVVVVDTRLCFCTIDGDGRRMYCPEEWLEDHVPEGGGSRSGSFSYGGEGGDEDYSLLF